MNRNLSRQFQEYYEHNTGDPYYIHHSEEHDKEGTFHEFNARTRPRYDEGLDAVVQEHRGTLRVDHDPQHGWVIGNVEVTPDHTTEGIASQLYRTAQEHLGEVKHSNVMTGAGRKWAKKVGGPHVPGPKTRIVL